MGNGEFSHVVLLLAERYEIVVDASLVFAGIVEIKILSLHVVLAKFLGFKFRYFFQETLLLLYCHAPDHHSAVFEKKDFRRVDLGVKVQG